VVVLAGSVTVDVTVDVTVGTISLVERVVETVLAVGETVAEVAEIVLTVGDTVAEVVEVSVMLVATVPTQFPCGLTAFVSKVTAAVIAYSPPFTETPVVAVIEAVAST